MLKFVAEFDSSFCFLFGTLILKGLQRVGFIIILVVDQALDICSLLIEEIERNATRIPTAVTILFLVADEERMIVEIMDCRSFCNICLLRFEQYLPFIVMLSPRPLDLDGTETGWAFIAAASIYRLAAEATSAAAYQIPDFRYLITLVDAS